MTADLQTSQVPDNKPSDKELNFRNLQAKYERQLEQERAARIEAERIAQDATKRNHQDDDDDVSEPYVDHKKLDKKLSRLGQQTQTEIHKSMEVAKQAAKEELKQEMWLENNPDFYDVLQNAEKFAKRAPKLAESILRMPEGFERQKLVYQNIKELGLDKAEQKQPSIQEKIDSNRKSPFYQPTNIGNSPYASTGDFSTSGQKSAYDKMQELKSRLRL